uniref:Uncharacterized protein n=1 Tax=Manihot esculenta TaxID=3983 RepID=A0A199UB58_MANES
MSMKESFLVLFIQTKGKNNNKRKIFLNYTIYFLILKLKLL